VFINFWYPAIESGQLNDEPVPVRMLGTDFVPLVAPDRAGANRFAGAAE
jgi:hypothetical protein